MTPFPHDYERLQPSGILVPCWTPWTVGALVIARWADYQPLIRFDYRHVPVTVEFMMSGWFPRWFADAWNAKSRSA